MFCSLSAATSGACIMWCVCCRAVDFSWVMPALSLNFAPLVRWAGDCRTFSKRMDGTVVFFWNTPKTEEQENSSLSTDCKIPTRSVWVTSKSLFIMSWAQLALLWRVCGTVEVSLSGTHAHTLPLSIQEEMKCSARKVWGVRLSLSSRQLLAGLAAFAVDLMVAEQSVFAQ